MTGYRCCEHFPCVDMCVRFLILFTTGQDVFHLNHDEALGLIKKAGDKLALVVERGDKIVPSLNSAFPKPKEAETEKPKSYAQEVKKCRVPNVSCFLPQMLDRTGRLPGQKDKGFTTVTSTSRSRIHSILSRWVKPRWRASSTTPP